jgi:pyruvate/2-oxoglutarate dehydrogenase complex dihydrolipoamide acyltransferase (E2) component
MPEQHEVDDHQVVYDHETETSGGRRRRPVADWGVGEEMFDHLPRRRFNRAGEPQRRESHPRERAAVAAPAAAPAAPAPAPVAEAPQPRPDAVEVEPRIDTFDGCCTVVISGRPGETAAPAVRRRAPRTVGERVSHRPDRIAMWAVALGMLLILIAILTAGA